MHLWPRCAQRRCLIFLSSLPSAFLFRLNFRETISFFLSDLDRLWCKPDDSMGDCCFKDDRGRKNKNTPSVQEAFLNGHRSECMLNISYLIMPEMNSVSLYPSTVWTIWIWRQPLPETDENTPSWFRLSGINSHLTPQCQTCTAPLLHGHLSTASVQRLPSGDFITGHLKSSS